MLTADQISDYQRDGFLVLRGQIPDADIDRLEQGFARHPPNDGTLADAAELTYPEPGRYTLSIGCLKEPDLAFAVEHPAIVTPAAQLLGDEPRLTAFVVYDRTPGGPGIGAHHDYKRWRPVGSSMNWLFTIVPFCDYDAATGPLFVAPGSHRLDRIHPGVERPLEVEPAVRPPESAFIDPELRRGDLLLMNMHLWHKAAPNTSDRHRAGLFNKYAAAGAPPATGSILFDDGDLEFLSPAGRSLIGAHSPLPLGTTRGVLVREQDAGQQVFLCRGDEGWHLPGGPVWNERAIPDWDLGNVIASLREHLREQLRIETPWVTHLGDYDEGDHRTRVYGYTLPGHGFPVPYREGEWVGVDDIDSRLDAMAQSHDYVPDAVRAWLDPAPVRGKGLTQAQCRIDQFAY
jgi:hypothetical protein